MGKYEEALERARQGKPIDEVFPELKESEDERIRKILINIVKGAYCKYGIKCGGDEFGEEKILAYLERQKEPKYTNSEIPKEWSEEDKEMLDAMIDIVSNSIYEPLCPREGMLDWLKALQPHWKPSEEQVEAVSRVKKAIGPGPLYDRLGSLLNDLKKLM